MRAIARALLFVVLLVAVLQVRPRVALAAGDTTVTAAADSTKIGLGDRVHIHLRAMSSSAHFSDPQLTANAMSFDASAPSVMPTQSVNISNGVMTQRIGLDVDWTLQAKHIGSTTFTPRVKVDGKVVSANSITLTVVPPGQGQQTRPPSGGRMDPNDPLSIFRQFGMQMPNGFDPFSMQNGFDQPTAPMRPNVPLSPKLALPAPRGQGVFLHAVLDKTTAYVGEQVTYTVYLYSDPDMELGELTDPHDPPMPDFTRQQLTDPTKSSQKDAEFATVGDRIWVAVPQIKWALFPLRAGNLEIGAFRLSVVSSGGARKSLAAEPLAVHVEEPPLAGRPPGYVSGNVGQFALTADVSPREVEQGGAIAVDLTLSGNGNLPGTITAPPQKGVDWLAPEIRDDLAPTKSGGYGGSRRFTFIAHMNKAGDVDLGDIAIPFFDPDKKAYDVARAVLGTIHVKPNANAEVTAKSEEVLAGLPAARDGLANDAPRKHLADRPLFVLALLFSPLAFVVAAGGRAASRRWRSITIARKQSPESELARRIADAKSAGKGADAHAIDAATTKVLEQASIVRANVNVRALSIDDVEDALVLRGVARDVAHDTAEVLRECAESRFVPDAGSVESSRKRLDRALSLVGDLGKRKERE